MILISLGTRAELIKMAPVMRELARRKMPFYFLHAGQHRIDDLIKALSLKEPDEVLDRPDIVRGRFGVATFKALAWDLKMFWRIRAAIKRVKPQVVLVHGDTMTTAVTSLATRSLCNRPRLGHVEAGIRSGDLLEPFPEEISRRKTDFLADYCFAPTKRAVENLKKEGKRISGIFLTGNTNVDVLLENLSKSKSSRLSLPSKPYVFAQMHRQENIRRRERCEGFIEVLKAVKRPVVFIFLENARMQFDKFDLIQKLKQLPNVKIYDNLPYHDFLKVFSNADCIFTDGGGQTEEAAVLRIPTVLWRRASERVEAEEAGTAVRVGSDAKKAINFIQEALSRGPFYSRAKKAVNPFGKGDAGKKIVAILEKQI